MTSRLAEMQAKFQQRQIQEREEKLLRLYESQQQRAFDRVSRGSAGSNTSLGSTGGKVRQMFDERRQKAGVDKSYPLEPLKSKSTIVKSTIVKSTMQKSVMKNGKPVKREVVRAVYDNNNGEESYREERFDEIVDLMNNHNVNETLDDEEMPRIGFDEPDFGKSGKLMPSQNGNRPALGKTFRKDTKPIVKRTVKPAASASSLSPVQPPAPARTALSQTMQSRKPVPKASSSASRTPTNTRPSAKQSAKSPVVRDDLTECRFCSRRFATDRLEVHEAICGKTAKKKRKAYDATRHRVEGTELEQYVRKGKTISAKTSKHQTQKKDWRKTHEEFINAIRSAKQAQVHLAKGGKLSDLPPPPPSSNPDYVQCPHCGRKFNEAAAERHIPKCATYQFNKPKAGPPQRAKVSGKR